MLLLPQRNPVYTAKEVGHPGLAVQRAGRPRGRGRVAGGGVQRRQRAVAPAGRAHRRVPRAVLRTLWCDETSSYEGEFYSLDPCQMFPKPVQQPHPPIHIGGESQAALARVARAGQGWHTFNRTPDQLAEPLATLDALLADQGRTRSDVTITVCPYFQPLDADIAGRYAEAGADVGGRAAPPVQRGRREAGPSTTSNRCSTGRRPPDPGAPDGRGQPPMATGSDSMPRSTTLDL